MSRAKQRTRAKRLLEDAVPHVGHDVLVLAPGVNGHGYLGTSMPTKTAADLDDVLTLAREGVRKLVAMQRRRRREEGRAASERLA